MDPTEPTAQQTSSHGPQRIIGIDFSGAADAGKRIWIAEGITEDARLHITTCNRARDLPGSGPRRDQCLAALRSFIKAQGLAAVGLDFPFSLPAALIEAKDWESFVRSFGERYVSPQAFRQACRAAAGGVEPKRATDRKSHTPFSPYNLRLFRQTYYGIRDLLAPLLRARAVCVLPMQPAVPARPWLLEVCPASTLKLELPALYVSYKGRSAEHRKARRRILEAARERSAMSLPDAVRNAVLDDAGGDALDSVIAAWATLRAVRQPDQPSDGQQQACALEGYVYV